MTALLEHTERFLPVGRCQNAISMLFQCRCDESPHPLFVLPQQDAPAAPGRRLGGCFQYHDSFDRRKENRKRRAAPDFALHEDMASTLAYYSIDRCQPEPSALAYLLGGEERLEDMFQRAHIHAKAGGSNRQANLRSGVGRFDGQLTSTKHDVTRINPQ